MMQIDMADLKKDLDNLLFLLETGQEEGIVIERQGKPVIKMVRVNVQVNKQPVEKRIGIAKGKLRSPVDLDSCNDEIAELFGVK